MRDFQKEKIKWLKLQYAKVSKDIQENSLKIEQARSDISKLWSEANRIFTLKCKWAEDIQNRENLISQLSLKSSEMKSQKQLRNELLVSHQELNMKLKAEYSAILTNIQNKKIIIQDLNLSK